MRGKIKKVFGIVLENFDVLTFEEEVEYSHAIFVDGTVYYINGGHIDGFDYCDFAYQMKGLYRLKNTGLRNLMSYALDFNKEKYERISSSIKELTVQEISDLLGYEVKIIK